MSDSSQTFKYRDLTFQKARVADTNKDFERVYLGSRTPSNSELKDLATEFAKRAADLRLLYVGVTGLDGMPADESAAGNNAIVLLFTAKASLQRFLNEPIPPSMKGISLVLDVTPPPRL